MNAFIEYRMYTDTYWDIILINYYALVGSISNALFIAADATLTGVNDNNMKKKKKRVLRVRNMNAFISRVDTFIIVFHSYGDRPAGTIFYL